jgi:uncharacterized protein YbdZ (MbtH family)
VSQIAIIFLLLFLALGTFVAVSKVRASASQQADEISGAVTKARKDIEKFGWHVVMVEGEDGPGFLYTIGLWETYKKPEILIVVPNEDPSGFAGNLAAIAKRAAQGEELKNGATLPGAFGKFPGAVRDVLPRWYPSFLGIAGAYYGNSDFPAVQLYWSDPNGLFPWQSGFDAKLFPHQPILNENNIILANVGYGEVQQLIAEEGPQVLDAALAELFITHPDLEAPTFLDEWRWRIGSEAKLLRVSLFGDLFLQTPDGDMHWLDTGANIYYEKIATNQEDWLRAMCNDLPVFFHASTLLNLRSIGHSPKETEVYSWISPPLLGGKDSVDNLDIVSARVHLISTGRGARSVDQENTETEAVDKTIYTVVINGEKQYSMWPADRKILPGWTSSGKSGTKQECMVYIEKVWVDMRPESVQNRKEDH